ncbi:hypothetical protein DH86_00003140, partial [Scytalidium sp. 3C]
LSRASQGRQAAPKAPLDCPAIRRPNATMGAYNNLNLKGRLRLYFLGVFFGLGSFVWGYNIGIISTLYVSPGWIKALHNPSAAQKGLITAIYYLGTWLTYVFLSSTLSDKLGRRYAAFIGAFVSAVGTAIQTGANGSGGYAMMIVGRIICGVGNALISTNVPMYLSEIAPATLRGSLVVMNHIGMTTGLSIGFWSGYGFRHWTNVHSFTEAWRFSYSLQFIPTLIFCVGLPFVPETPRWLLEHSRIEEARKALQFLRGYDNNPEVVEDELTDVRENMELHSSIYKASWRELFTQRNLFARLWRASLLQFMAQMCGSTAIKYYLPSNFLALGLGEELSLLASGIESTLKIGCTIIASLVIDRLGRRRTLLWEVYPNNENRAAVYTCVVFIFVFSLGYSLSFGPNTWVYGSEIFPTNMRAKGLSISASAGSIGSIVVGQVWPVAQANIGSRGYYIFFSFNFACIILLYFFFPETKGKTLEELDNLFGKVDQSFQDPERDGNVTKIDEHADPKELKI